MQHTRRPSTGSLMGFVCTAPAVTAGSSRGRKLHGAWLELFPLDTVSYAVPHTTLQCGPLALEYGINSTIQLYTECNAVRKRAFHATTTSHILCLTLDSRQYSTDGTLNGCVYRLHHPAIATLLAVSSGIRWRYWPTTAWKHGYVQSVIHAGQYQVYK